MHFDEAREANSGMRIAQKKRFESIKQNNWLFVVLRNSHSAIRTT